jgi:phage antirepressor YoqD-like protein
MEILNLEATMKMTSKEVADLLETRHDSVKRTVERLSVNRVIPQTPLVDGIKSANGVVERVYFLDKRSSLIVVAQISPEFTARLVDRWQELEAKQNQPAFKVPQTLSEALRLAADQQDTIVAQAAQLALAAPSVAYVENFVKCDGLIGIREAAKSLGLQQNAFVQMLVAAKIIFRENGHLQAYAADIEAKRFAVKVTKDLSGKARSQTMLTAKGIRWVANKLELDKLFAND